MPDPIEIFASLSSLAFVALGIRQHPLCWPLGLLGVLAYAWVFFQAKLYAELGLQGVYILQSLYGWYLWYRPQAASPERPIQLLGWPLRLGYLLACALAWGGIYSLLIHYTDADLPLWDSLSVAFSLGATFLLAHKYLENWLWWIGIDALIATLLFYKGLPLSGLTYLVFMLMAARGYVLWKKALIEQKPSLV